MFNDPFNDSLGMGCSSMYVVMNHSCSMPDLVGRDGEKEGLRGRERKREGVGEADIEEGGREMYHCGSC